MQFKKILEIDNSFQIASYYIFLSYIHQGMFRDGVAEIQKALSLDTVAEQHVQLIGDVFNKSGISGVILWLIDYLKFPESNPYHAAVLYSAINEKEKALQYLEKAFEIRSSQLPAINVDPGFDNLRSDPRFVEMVKRLGLKE